MQSLARKFIEQTNSSIFLTGKAGTGKTTFLREIIEITHKNTVVAAPTGIAAINAGGVTLHSLFQLPFGIFLPDDGALNGNEFNENINTPHSLLSRSRLRSQKRKIIQKMDLLVIDEVSMLRADLLDAIDYTLRSVRRKRHEPFGGVQLLFIGDLLQLPPVVQRHEWQYLQGYYSNMYFFNAKVLRDNPPVYIEFEKIYRQSDEGFIKILNKFRDNSLLPSDINKINEYHDPQFNINDHSGYIFITTHNRKADAINREKLDEIEDKPYTFSASVSGDFNEKMFPADESLVLKKGAQVMFIKNDPSGEGKYFNGKIGNISWLSSDSATVSFTDGTEDIDVESYLWENKRYVLDNEKQELKEDTIGTFSQLPLKLAWAITIHKSQGLTFEKAVLDLSDAFVSGQMYVALSRLTSLDGLVLASPVPQKQFSPDRELTEFIKENYAKKLTEEHLNIASESYFKDLSKKSFSFDNLISEFNEYLKTFDKSENSPKQKDYLWVKETLNKFIPLNDVASKFGRQIDQIFFQDKAEKLPFLLERVKKARSYFNPELTTISNEIQTHIEEVNTKKGTKKYTKELKELKSLIYQQFVDMKKSEKLLESLLDKTDFRKDTLHNPEDEIERKLISEVKKKTKSDTREMSRAIYKDTGSVQATAEKRGMAISTIESHLAVYVKKGELNVLDFVEKEKLDNIITVIETIQEKGLSKIKEKLGDEYTYQDIKFALSYYDFINSGNKN